MFDIADDDVTDLARSQGAQFEGSRSEGSRSEGDGTESFDDVSGVLLAHLLGQVLSNLPGVADGLEGDARLVDIAVGLARLEAWSVAQRARVLAELERRIHDEMREHGLLEHGDSRGTTAWASHRFDDARLTQRILSTEVSLATGTTPWAADRELDLAAALTLHPILGIALARGRIDRRRVQLLLDEIAVLDRVAQADVVASVVGDGTHACDHPDPALRPPELATALIRPLRRPGARLLELQPQALRRAVRHEVEAADIEAATRRECQARAGRHVEHATLPAAMAEIRIVGPAAEVGAAFAAIDQRARAMRHGDEGRTLDQLRCDVAVGALSEGAFGERPEALKPAGRPRAGAPALVVISMSDHTALGLDDRPATLHGPSGASSLPAEVARTIAYDPEQATWLALYRHPQSGIATDVSHRHRPPRRMQTFVRLRDGLRSRLPIESGSVTELDHVTPYDHDDPARGGTTTAAGLETLGLRGHHLKTDGVLAVSGDANGALVFRTRTGHEYVSWPEDWGDDPPVRLRAAG